MFSTLSSGLCSIGLYFVYNKYHNLIVSAFFSGVISCGNAALDCLITEVFPTHLRATGIAISMVAARLGGIIGNIVIAQLLDMYCPAPTFIVAGLLIGKPKLLFLISFLYFRLIIYLITKLSYVIWPKVTNTGDLEIRRFIEPILSFYFLSVYLGFL